MHSESTVFHVWPEQKCTYCPRLTTLGIISSQGLSYPVCPLHGYIEPFSPHETTQTELERQLESIKRFVVWMYGEQGRVTLVSPVHKLRTIPGYQEIPEEVEDSGFFAGYTSPSGQQIGVYAVWSATFNQFFLYSESREYKDRVCTWIESRGRAS